MKKLIALIAFCLVCHMGAEKSGAQDVFVPECNSVQSCAAQYEACLLTIQQMAVRYSTCKGRLIERGVLPGSFGFLPVEYFLFGAVITDFPSSPAAGQALVEACSYRRAEAGLHMQACEAGI